MDTKPAAIDSNIFKRQHHQHYFPHQQSTYPTQASKDALYFGGPLDRFSQNQDLTGVKMNNRKAPPTASSATEIRMKSLKTPPSASTQRSEQSHHGQSVRKSNPKAPPVRSLSGRTSLRSYRATSLATKMDDNTKNRPSEVIKLTRSKTCVGSNAKTINKEMNLSLSMQPTQTQMTEARGPRKVEALRTWYKRLGELICFKDSHGHANVPQKYAKNHKLGIWVNKQRMEKKAKDAGKGSSLTDEKIQLLEEAGFVWAKTKGQTAWEEKFSELQDYLRDNGHCNVPTKNKNNRALGRWVSTQRSNHKKFQSGELLKHPRMDQEELERRISRLNGIGFAWSLLPGTTRFEGDDDNEGKRNESTTHSTTSPEKKEEDDHDGADIDSPY